MGELHDKMVLDLELRGRSEPTKKDYPRRVRQLAKYFRRSPSELGEDEVRVFLAHLMRERKVGTATQHAYVAAFKFFFDVTVKRPEVVAAIPYPRRPQKLPDVLSRDEVERLLSSVHSLKYRALFMTAYGAGLRISEACSLRATDLDRERMLIHVRRGKGKKDRYVMLSTRLLACLEEYWLAMRPRGAYLFPGRPVEKSVSRKMASRVLAKAVAGLPEREWHGLRHSFGTHAALLGVNPWRLQAWMGHGRIDETMIYVHVASAHQRPLPAELRVAVGTDDPDRRILVLLGQRVRVKWAEPDRRCITVASRRA